VTFTVYALCWNEMFLLPHFFKHYEWADRIVIYDNESDDGSQEFIKKQKNAELRIYKTSGGWQDNLTMIRIKNTCWKGDTSDLVVICDMDEFLIDHEKAEPYVGNQVVFDCLWWEMVSEKVPEDFKSITMKFNPTRLGSKALCFNPTIDAINYLPGAHLCHPVPNHRISGVLSYNHYSALSEEYLVSRWSRYRSRTGDKDKKYGYGHHYFFSDEKIRQLYKEKLCSAQLNS